MYANQILKQISVSRYPEWNSDAYAFQSKSMSALIKKHHQFYLGEWANFKMGFNQRMIGPDGEGRRLFIGGIARNLKLPYSSFLLCYSARNFDNQLVKYAIFVSRFDSKDSGITMEYMINGPETRGWMLTPYTRLYLFNKTLEEGRDCWSDVQLDPMIDGDSALYNTNTCIFPYVEDEIVKKFSFTDPSSEVFRVQLSMSATVNYFLLLYNQRYIVTETVYKHKRKKKKKKNNNRLFEYKVLCVSLPRSGKRYRYGEPAQKGSKGIMPFTEIPAGWKHYSEEGGGMFGNPKLVGDFYVPEHVRGSKQAGFAGKDYCVKTKD